MENAEMNTMDVETVEIGTDVEAEVSTFAEDAEVTDDTGSTAEAIVMIGLAGFGAATIVKEGYNLAKDVVVPAVKAGWNAGRGAWKEHKQKKSEEKAIKQEAKEKKKAEKEAKKAAAKAEKEGNKQETKESK